MLKKTVWIGMVLLLVMALPLLAQRPANEKNPQEARENHEKAMGLKITDGPRVEGVGTNWAVIAWTTNTGGSSIVRYGTKPNGLNETAEAPYADNEKTSAQNHRVRLNNLKPATTYYFLADSGQGEGTGTESRSSTGQFTTKGH